MVTELEVEVMKTGLDGLGGVLAAMMLVKLDQGPAPTLFTPLYLTR